MPLNQNTPIKQRKPEECTFSMSRWYPDGRTDLLMRKTNLPPTEQGRLKGQLTGYATCTSTNAKVRLYRNDQIVAELSGLRR